MSKMVKNILITVSVIAVVAVLVIGGINRTSAILGRDQTRFGAYEYSGQTQRLGARNDDFSKNRGYPGRNIGRQDGHPEKFGGGKIQVTEWLTVEGAVKAVDNNILTIATTTGGTITIENRAWWFVQEQGFQVAVGDLLRLRGFNDSINGSFETVQMENLTSGQTVWLRDESGKPLWSGRGRSG
jgi:hypothetical protein